MVETVPAAPATSATGRRFAHQPALDGLRALAVSAVVLFHAGVRGFGGGYVGVSVFFTLSGFLITSLLLREHAASGRVDAAGFYARRARRLLPASAVCLTAVIVLATFGAWGQVEHLRTDVWAAALQVFNWLRLGGSSSYGALFARSGGQVSPLEHYWSLAIEEQFYWVWPLGFAALARWAVRSERPLPRVLAIPAVVAVAAAPLIAWWAGPDAAYWSTFARVGEILTGTVAAAIVAERGAPRWARPAAPFCLAAIGAAVVLFPSVGGPAYHGWLPLLSIVTAVLLMGVQSDGNLRRGLSWGPFVALGTISYGVYLYHWPIFTLVDQERLGFGGPALLGIRLALTLVAAVASYRLIERPVRRARWSPRPTLVAGAALTVMVLALSLFVPNRTLTIDTAGEAAATAAISPRAPTRSLTAVAGTSVDAVADRYSRKLVAPVPSRPVRILVLGDSTAKATGGGLARWAAAHPKTAQVSIAAASGCGFVQGGVRVFAEGEQRIGPACARYVRSEIPAKVAALHPDVVVLQTTSWDVIDQRFAGTGPEAPTDAEYGRRIRHDLASVTRAALAAGAGRVVWVAEPTVDPFWRRLHSPQEEAPRHEVLHRAMRDLATRDPKHVAVADLAWWLSAEHLEKDRDARPDGVHLSTPAAEKVASDWLGPFVVQTSLRS